MRLASLRISQDVAKTVLLSWWKVNDVEEIKEDAFEHI